MKRALWAAVTSAGVEAVGWALLAVAATEFGWRASAAVAGFALLVTVWAAR